ncbi:MAG TPA: GreA/GreB family elongation factor [bacterium]|nr:GreA/GreB family elongation factor [bacterium]HPN67107.1 GreA/GreB family elongation factor [bacterium]
MTSVNFKNVRSCGRIEDRLNFALNKHDEAKRKIKELLEQGRAVLETPEYNEAKMEVLYWQKRAADLRRINYGGSRRSKKIGLGSKVKVKYGAIEREYTIVTSIEADPANGYISEISPLGRALLNKEETDRVEVSAPSGKFEYEVKAVS